MIYHNYALTTMHFYYNYAIFLLQLCNFFTTMHHNYAIFKNKTMQIFTEKLDRNIDCFDFLNH